MIRRKSRFVKSSMVTDGVVIFFLLIELFYGGRVFVIQTALITATLSFLFALLLYQLQRYEKYVDDIEESYPLWRFLRFPDEIKLYSISDRKIKIDWVRLYVVEFNNDRVQSINKVPYGNLKNRSEKMEQIYPGKNAVCVSPDTWKLNPSMTCDRSTMVVITANTQYGEETVFFQGHGLSASYHFKKSWMGHRYKLMQYDGEYDKSKTDNARRIYEQLREVANNEMMVVNIRNQSRKLEKKLSRKWIRKWVSLMMRYSFIIGLILFVVAVLLQRIPVLSISLLFLSALVVALKLMRMLFSLSSFVFNNTNRIWNRYKLRHNHDFGYSLKHNNVAKSPYFFKALTDKVKANGHKNIKDYNILKMRLKTSLTNENGNLNMKAVFDRDDKYLELVKLFSLDELYHWRVFFETKEAPHSVKGFFTGLVYSTFTIAVIRAVWPSIVKYANGENYVIFNCYVVLVAIFIVLMMIVYYVDRADQEKMSLYNLSIIKRAIEEKLD